MIGPSVATTSAPGVSVSILGESDRSRQRPAPHRHEPRGQSWAALYLIRRTPVLSRQGSARSIKLSSRAWLPDSPPDMVGSCLVCFQGVSGCRPGVTHDMIGHRTGSRAPSLRVSAAVRCQLWLFSGRRRHGQAWQLGRVAYKPMLQAGLLCSIRLGSQRQYPLPRPEQQLV